MLFTSLSLPANAAVADSATTTVSITFVDSGITSMKTEAISDTEVEFYSSLNTRVYAKALTDTPVKLSIADPKELTFTETSPNVFSRDRHAQSIELTDQNSFITDKRLVEIDTIANEDVGIQYTIVNGP